MIIPLNNVAGYLIGLIFRWEFIQHVLSSSPSRFDEHFRPIYLLCSSCSYDFNYILRYENISVEEPFFVQHLGAEGDVDNDTFVSIKIFYLTSLIKQASLRANG